MVRQMFKNSCFSTVAALLIILSNGSWSVKYATPALLFRAIWRSRMFATGPPSDRGSLTACRTPGIMGSGSSSLAPRAAPYTFLLICIAKFIRGAWALLLTNISILMMPPSLMMALSTWSPNPLSAVRIVFLCTAAGAAAGAGVPKKSSKPSPLGCAGVAAAVGPPNKSIGSEAAAAGAAAAGADLWISKSSKSPNRSSSP
mmetsp:Transcript_3599/g.6922  ORF Transcript_3599/g.6922 Transcript_3599/m.6922 type:complete len:201 (+) Transcript_3599:2836-3438(+)